MWFVAEEIPGGNWILMSRPIGGAVKELGEITGVMFEKLVLEYWKGTVFIISRKEEWASVGRKIFDRVVADPSFAEKINSLIHETSTALFEEGKRVSSLEFRVMSDEKLLKNFESFAQAHHECHSLAWPWFVTETDNNFITGFVQKIVERRVRSSSLNIPAGEAFSILTTPTKESQAIREEKSFLSLLEKIAADEKAVSVFKEYGKEGFKYLKGELSNEFEKHHVSFGWLPYMYEGPAWEREYFSETISSIIKQGKLSKNALKEYTKEKKSFAEKQAELEEKLGFTSNELRLVRIAREIVFGKGYRKDAIYYSWCMAEPLVKEIASRLGFSPRQTRALCSWEVRNALVEHKFTARELDERFHYSAMLYTPAGNEFFAGKAARDFMAPINSEAKEISAEEVVSLFGNCACPGSVRGVARIINVPSDMEKMKPGDVLVSYATNPNLVPAMKKAAAIVTDMGGITCHAAIVSRELGIPCVIGTKNATKLLKDGDVVEVDATHGIVKKIS